MNEQARAQAERLKQAELKDERICLKAEERKSIETEMRKRVEVERKKKAPR